MLGTLKVALSGRRELSSFQAQAKSGVAKCVRFGWKAVIRRVPLPPAAQPISASGLTCQNEILVGLV